MLYSSRIYKDIGFEDTAEIRFFVVRSAQFSVSRYWAQNGEFKGGFDSSYSRLLNVKT